MNRCQLRVTNRSRRNRRLSLQILPRPRKQGLQPLCQLTVHKLQHPDNLFSALIHGQDDDIFSLVRPLFLRQPIIFYLILELCQTSGPNCDLSVLFVLDDLLRKELESIKDRLQARDVLDEAVGDCQRWEGGRSWCDNIFGAGS